MAAVIATICARGGSKGLPRKNVLPFCGRPLIEWSIAQALACSRISAVYVSTDDEEIAAVAERCGALVPFRRPAHLATDGAAKIPVIEHLVNYVETSGIAVSRVIDLQPTSPLRTVEDLVKALDLDPLGELTVSVTDPSHNPYYSLVETREDGTLALSKPSRFVSRQEATSAFGLNGSIYVWSRAALARAAVDGIWSVKSRAYWMPRNRSIDIDDEEDFQIAEWLQAKAECRRIP